MSAGYLVHTVGPGDTIQAIGDVYGVDWTQIVGVNGLRYPYINTEPESPDNEIGPGVATIGRQLVIPTGEMMFPVRIEDSQLDIEQYILGTDLDIYGFMESEHQVIRIGDAGELIDNGGGDLYIARGLRNLRQQLVTRLGTQKGALLLHPEYGSDINKYIGKTITPELLTDVKLCVQECLLTDFRVAGVSALTVTSQSAGLLVDCIIHVIEPFGSFRLKALLSAAGATLVG